MKRANSGIITWKFEEYISPIKEFKISLLPKSFCWNFDGCNLNKNLKIKAFEIKIILICYFDTVSEGT